ncbi:MAG TPA: NUDIX domain-containing protein [Gaiellaceae bacterium]|nr:NUDIX domain-containing protein [Gaiellaceae bacterium]
MGEPRVRVAVLVRWQNRILLCRQEKPGREYWLLPGGGVDGGETLTVALRRELAEELGLRDEFPLEGPIAVAESIAPGWQPGDRHIVHIVFGADLSDRSLEDVETHDAAVRGARLFTLEEVGDVVLHPPITRFVQRWRPGDPAVYLGSLWSR